MNRVGNNYSDTVSSTLLFAANLFNELRRSHMNNENQIEEEKTSEFLEKIKDEPLSLESIHAIHTKEDSIEILKAIYLSE